MGACIRHWQGEVIAIKVDVLLDGTNNLAEAQALLIGLILAKRCNVSTIHIEGDSQVIINSCDAEINSMEVNTKRNQHQQEIDSKILLIDLSNE